jgi:hypothetical protein
MPFGWINFVRDVRWQPFAQLIRRSVLNADTSDKIIDSGILIIILTTDGSGKSTTPAVEWNATPGLLGSVPNSLQSFFSYSQCLPIDTENFK